MNNKSSFFERHSFWTLVVFSAILIFALAGCSSAEQKQETPNPQTEAVDVNVASLKGATSIGLADFISAVEEGSAAVDNNYEFSISGTADEILPSLIRGDVDIALIPANAASSVYNKTDGAVQALNVNTLGTLYVVTADETVNSITDLANRTVLMTGKGTTPEYVMMTLLEKAGIVDRVGLDFKSESTEIAATLSADPMAVAVLPEPYVTAVIAKTPELEKRISVTEAWKEATEEELVTGVTVVRKEFAEQHPEVVKEFAAAQAASIAAVNADPQAAAPKIVKLGIIENEEIAAKAVPGCNLAYLSGTEMKSALSSYLTALFAQSPDSIGGALPSDDFYLPQD